MFNQIAMINFLKELPFILLDFRKTRGFHLFKDLRFYRKEKSTKVIFDIGANHGEFAIKFSQYFKNANIYCFEPVKSTFNVLEKNLSRYSNFKIFQKALGDKAGIAKIYLNKESDLVSSLVPNSKFHSSSTSEDVEVLTIDGFCQENGIKKIDILKIDVEGFELNVLEGAKNMLMEKKIDFIILEAGFGDTFHTRLDELVLFLAPFQYKILGIYDFDINYKKAKQSLESVNVLFKIYENSDTL